MIFWAQGIAGAGALGFGLALASPSLAQTAGASAHSEAAIFWNTAQCVGGYTSEFYSAHCDPGPAAVILDFRTKTQFSCTNNEAVDVRWTIPADSKSGPPIPPGRIDWRPECWKAPLRFEVDPDTTVLTPQYTQLPPPNYYMSMNVVVLYDAAKPAVKICLVPLFPRFAVEPACADAEIRP
jgi:hypothetical protein